MYRETEGNPLFIEETLRTLTTEDGIDVSCQRLLEIPKKIKDIILMYVTKLDSRPRKILDYLSVIGDHANLLVLKHCVDIDEETLLDSVDKLINWKIIYEESLDHSIAYRFTHCKIREVVYDALTDTRKIISCTERLARCSSYYPRRVMHLQ